MELVGCFLSTIFCGTLALLILVHAQDQSGFISIDCGIPTSYTDETTDINYLSDSGFIGTGVNEKISSEINTTFIDKQYLTLRSFPEGSKHCYTLKPAQGKNNTYLIRAGFLYGNYDHKDDVPRFDLYLGVNWWATVNLYDAKTPYSTEIIYILLSDSIDICLVNTGFGAPFISVLELRVLNRTTYVTTGGSLQLYGRVDCGLTSKRTIRYPNDVYDRIWSNFTSELWNNLSASSAVQSITQNGYRVPLDVMKTAVTQVNDSLLRVGFYAWRDNPNAQFYFYLHFSEIQELQQNQYRAFNIYINNKIWYGPLEPKYMRTTTIFSTSPAIGTQFEFRLNKTKNSTLPPLLNAAEAYLVRNFSDPETYQQDVDAITNIKSTYDVNKYWQGDPCQPEIAIWDGLNCSYNVHDPPRIISLNLSSSGLTGEIALSISKLVLLQYLDLSKNRLTGKVPEFLSKLAFLRVLNLEENDLSGSVPQELMERSKNGTLLLSVRGNRNLCTSNLCKHKFIVPLVSTIGAVLILLLIALAIFWIKKRGKQGIFQGCRSANDGSGAFRLRERHFAYSEVLGITNNLEKIVGKGNFGTVYHGYLDDIPVAIKFFSPSSVHGYKQFQADAKLITKVHHRHLTSSFGYFEEGNEKGIIYEFMENGSLGDILSGKNAVLLSWQERLQIAMDVAQGLDYLHNSCKPPIVHGNLKPTNILFNENYQAKLVDFGFSKISTAECGTPEYVDPEYHVTNKLTARSDVFSFGVVLLATIANRPPVMTNRDEKTHISQWVSSLVSTGDIKSVVDPRLKDDFHVDSAWKAVELALACVSPVSIKRPNTSLVVMELNQCLAMEITRISRSGGAVELVTVNLGTGVVPQAR